ncbi:MAG: serine/threonine protein kinase, partial [Phycisphaerae bacterium]|nr:serine/threonine protein kinase [Phycisphaerae bacterium]
MGPEHQSQDSTRDRRVGEALNRYLDRKSDGQAESEAEFLAQHPDLADALRTELAFLQQIAQPGDNALTRLVRTGLLQPADDAAYPARLGDYQVRRVIGRGGMGVVTEANDPRLRRTVALKLLRPELFADRQAVARFEREARAAAGLNHPNIVGVYELGRHEDTPFMAMEYVPGPSVAELLRRHGPLPAALTEALFGQLLAGLEAAHQAGLVHRDIKPSNLLLTADPLRPDGHDGASAEPPPAPRGGGPGSPRPAVTLKIADFGLARVAGAETRLTVPDGVVGTPDYMSPEQARGSADVDARSDLFNAGLVLYEMLTGCRPFAADSASAVIHRILNEDPRDPRSIQRSSPPVLAALCLRLLAKRPEDRLMSAGEALTALASGRRVGSPQRRRRVAAFAWRGVVAAVVLGVAAWFGARVFNSAPAPSPPAPAPPAPSTPATNVAPLPPIEAVRVHRDATNTATGTVLISRKGRVNEEPFRPFPSQPVYVSCVDLVDRDGRGDTILVVGMGRSINGRCLFAYDHELKEIPGWKPNLNDARVWPDCEAPHAFGCTTFEAADVDGEPGEELVVIATEGDQYATRLSVVDSWTGSIRSTYWHTGGLSHVRVSRKLVPGKVLIVAAGQNNLLEGRADLDKEPRDLTTLARLTEWDLTPVVMVLDAAALDGLCPQPLADIDIPPARPLAYGFFEFSSTGASPKRGEKRVQRPVPGPGDTLVFDKLILGAVSDPEASGFNRERIQLHVARAG